MFQMGCRDFAGGVVVHEAAGFSALAAVIALGRRKPMEGMPRSSIMRPHNIPFVMMGTCVLWFGWFGFNGGSALSSGGLAGIAFVNTQIAPASALMVWVLIDLVRDGKPKLVGACCGAVSGMVAITPSAGYVQPSSSFLIGMIGSAVCYVSVHWIHWLEVDDAVDAAGVHGIGGLLGTFLVGIMADPAECGNLHMAPEWCADPGSVTRSWRQLLVQVIGGVFGGAYSFALTFLILKVMTMLGAVPILSRYEDQAMARDSRQHGEIAYVSSIPDKDVKELEDVDGFSSEDDSDDSGTNNQVTARDLTTPRVDSVRQVVKMI